MSLEYQLIKLKTVDSTNRFLKDYTTNRCPSSTIVCTTNEQTAGYGQQQRSWESNHHSAIFSIAYPVKPKSLIPGLLSLQVAHLLHRSLGALISDTLYLKWPNDLYNQNGKVAGILIEQVVQKDYQALIIGIGINRGSQKLVDTASQLSEFDTEQLIANFFQQIEWLGLLNFSANKLLNYWQAHDLFRTEEPVRLITAEKSDTQQDGNYMGININGQALIRVNDKIVPLSSGQDSIRKAIESKTLTD